MVPGVCRKLQVVLVLLVALTLPAQLLAAGPDAFLGWQSGKLVLWDGAKARPLMTMKAADAKTGKVYVTKGYLFYLEGKALKRKDLASNKVKVIDAKAIDSTYTQGVLYWDYGQNQLRFVASAPVESDAEIDDYLADEEYEETVKTREISLKVRANDYDMPYPRATSCKWASPRTSLTASVVGNKWRLKAAGKRLIDVYSPLPSKCDGGERPAASEIPELDCTMVGGSNQGLCTIQDFPCGQMSHGVCIWVDVSKGEAKEVSRGEGIEGYDCPGRLAPSKCWRSVNRKVVGKGTTPDIQFIHWIQ